MPEIKGGKGPMAPQGQAGRARAQAGRGGVWGGGQPCRRGRAGTLILTWDLSPPPPPPDSTPPLAGTLNLCVDPRPTPLAHVLRSRHPRLLKSSGGSEAARPLPGTPAPRPTCAGGGELSCGASEANRSAARRMRTSFHFPAPPPRLAKFAGNLPGRAPTGSGGSARVHRAGGGGRQSRVLAAPEGPPGPAALAPPLRPPAPPAR